MEKMREVGHRTIDSDRSVPLTYVNGLIPIGIATEGPKTEEEEDRYSEAAPCAASHVVRAAARCRMPSHLLVRSL